MYTHGSCSHTYTYKRVYVCKKQNQVLFEQYQYVSVFVSERVCVGDVHHTLTTKRVCVFVQKNEPSPLRTVLICLSIYILLSITSVADLRTHTYSLAHAHSHTLNHILLTFKQEAEAAAVAGEEEEVDPPPSLQELGCTFSLLVSSSSSNPPHQPFSPTTNL